MPPNSKCNPDVGESSEHGGVSNFVDVVNLTL